MPSSACINRAKGLLLDEVDNTCNLLFSRREAAWQKVVMRMLYLLFGRVLGIVHRSRQAWFDRHWRPMECYIITLKECAEGGSMTAIWHRQSSVMWQGRPGQNGSRIERVGQAWQIGIMYPTWLSITSTELTLIIPRDLLKRASRFCAKELSDAMRFARNSSFARQYRGLK